MNKHLSPADLVTATVEPVLVEADVATIVTGDRLRKVRPDQIEALQQDIAAQGVLQPIELVATEAGPRLVYGARRLAAVIGLGLPTIRALLYPAGAFGSELEIRQREIAENFVRFELTALERAIYIAEWRTIHETLHPPAKPGRKKKPTSDAELEELSAKFALNFTDTVQAVLGLSRRSVFLALKVASIGLELRDRIALHSIADNQSELLALAHEPADRQRAIVDLLTAQPPVANSIAFALQIIDKLPAPPILAAHERLSAGFARLRPADQDRFFDMHADAVERWWVARRS